MKANVMKEEIISPLESIVYYYDQNKELVLSCFIKPSQAKPFNFFVLIQFSYLLLKEIGVESKCESDLSCSL
jgi:hypothetical protein